RPPNSRQAARARRRGDRVRRRIKRRDFITLLGGAAAAWPVAARGQQSTMPVIGFLRSTAAAGSQPLVRGFRQGLNEAGFVEGQNVAVEYRWADDHVDRIPGMTAELVSRRAAVIVTELQHWV